MARSAAHSRTARRQRYRSPERIVAQIDRLCEEHTEVDIARWLNDNGLRTGRCVAFRTPCVQAIRWEYGLASLYERLRAPGLLNVIEPAARLGVSTTTVKRWGNQELLHAHSYNDMNERLYEPPGDYPSVKQQGRKPRERILSSELVTQRANDVQYEA